MAKPPKRKYHARPNTYQIVKGTVYMLTRNDPSKVLKFDADRLTEVLRFSWSVHAFKNGADYVSHRYHDTDGKWKIIPLATYLGYGRGFIHKNGDILDFTRTNMIPYPGRSRKKSAYSGGAAL